MGVYLSAPIVEKESVDEECNGFAFGASSMQGWRCSQEDAHNCIPEFIKESNTSFFAVYDGHGGAEVAKYCQLHFPEFVKSMLKKDSPDDLTDLMQSAFLQFDETLAEDDVVKKLKELAGKDDENDDDDDPDVPVGTTETDLLKAEADMPLEELLTRYKSDPSSDKSDVLKDGESSGCSSSGLAGSSSSAASSSSSSISPSSSHSTNGPVNSEEVSNNNNNKSDSIEENNPVEKAGGSSGAPVVSSVAGGSSKSTDDTGMGERASKTKALSDIATAEGIDDSSEDDDDDDDDEDDDEEEELWEDCDDDDDEEDEDVDNDVPMMDMTNEEPGSDSGCTACVVLKKKDKLIVANAGDSRCVLSRNGTAVELSFDHKPEDDPERERIEKAGGKVTSDGRVNGGLNLSRAFGDHVYKRNKDLPLKEQMISALPDIKTIDLESSDEFFVIACDGIWNFMSSQEVVDYVRERLSESEKRKKPSLINEELFDHCLAPNILGDGTGCDNMTCIIVVLEAAEKLNSEEGKVEEKSKESLENHSGTKDTEEKDSLKRNCVDKSETEEAKRVKVDESSA